MILEIVESPYNAISRAEDVLIANIMSEEQVQNNLQVSTQIPTSILQRFSPNWTFVRHIHTSTIKTNTQFYNNDMGQ